MRTTSRRRPVVTNLHPARATIRLSTPSVSLKVAFDLPKQLRETDFEGVGNPPYGLNRRIAPAPLDSTCVGAIDLSSVSEFLLGHPALKPQAPHCRTESGWEIGHRPKLGARRLTVHGLIVT